MAKTSRISKLHRAVVEYRGKNRTIGYFRHRNVARDVEREARALLEAEDIEGFRDLSKRYSHTKEQHAA